MTLNFFSPKQKANKKKSKKWIGSRWHKGLQLFSSFQGKIHSHSFLRGNLRVQKWWRGERHALTVTLDTCFHKKEGKKLISAYPETHSIDSVPQIINLSFNVYIQQQQQQKFQPTYPLFFHHHETMNQSFFNSGLMFYFHFVLLYFRSVPDHNGLCLLEEWQNERQSRLWPLLSPQPIQRGVYSLCWPWGMCETLAEFPLHWKW